MNASSEKPCEKIEQFSDVLLTMMSEVKMSVEDLSRKSGVSTREIHEMQAGDFSSVQLSDLLNLLDSLGYSALTFSGKEKVTKSVCFCQEFSIEPEFKDLHTRDEAVFQEALKKFLISWMTEESVHELMSQIETKESEKVNFPGLKERDKKAFQESLKEFLVSWVSDDEVYKLQAKIQATVGPQIVDLLFHLVQSQEANLESSSQEKSIDDLIKEWNAEKVTTDMPLELQSVIEPMDGESIQELLGDESSQS